MDAKNKRGTVKGIRRNRVQLFSLAFRNLVKKTKELDVEARDNE